jgi:WD40 repeat protein
VLATGAGKQLRFWSARGRLLEKAEPHEGTIAALFWLPDGLTACTASYGGLRFHAPGTAKAQRTLDCKGSHLAAAPRGDGHFIASGTQEGTVQVWRLKTGKVLEMSGYPGKVRALAWSPSGGLLATCASGAVVLWSFRGKGPAGQKPEMLKGVAGRASALAFFGERALLCAGEDGALHAWARRDGGWRRAARESLESPLHSLAVHGPSRLAAASSRDSTLACWSL